ncbi:MerR family transcriptional regulator [Secundilactobacillus collinoides]|uniref:MerR family transcriptional regulator n=2 Tax=Secundilactobacillus collinoides TaxID=33960 RepID=UPI0009EAD4D4
MIVRYPMCQLATDKLNCIFSLRNIVLNIGELSDATSVSQTRIRYWTSKNYLKSTHPNHSNQKYPLMSVFKVRLISYYLKLGYTLRFSTIKADEQIKANELGNIFK